MKILLSAAVLLAAGAFSAFAIDNENRCGSGSLVFYGKTLNHKKEVEICKFSNGFDYKFGKPDDIPDIKINIPANMVELEHLRGYDTGLTTITIPNGNVKYEVGYIMPEGMEGRYEITVRQRDKKLAVIKLDKDTVTSNISEYADSDDVD
ncbi:hypothetical protein ACQJ21_06570, partial [Klebsiella michiganensis]|uniref:hypothetical protein n=1 Tax=Klebsiella michiganensis TaxID=1134687 RepID=UPI003CFE2B34